MKYGHYTVIVLIGGNEIINERTLNEFEKLLPANEFFRVHRGYIVKLEEIIEITKRGNSCILILKSGKNIPLARRRKSLLFGMLKIIN